MLTGKKIITPAQENLLRTFPKVPDADRFYLTGGTP